MKKNISLILLSLLTLVAFTQCEDKKYKYSDAPVTGVDTYYAPVDERNIILQASATSSLYFEWEKATAQDNGIVYYDVLFDKVDGDFSNPLYIATADNRGTATGATITHRVLNQLAGFAGIEPSAEGKVKWAVMASRGLNSEISSVSRTLNVTRLSGIDAPDVLYLTGEATEGGADLEKALTVKGLDGGVEFEIITQLKAGKEYFFTDGKKGDNIRTFAPEDGNKVFKESDVKATVAKDGVYKLRLDFSTGAYTLEEFKTIGMYMTGYQKVVLPMEYIGGGKWEGTGLVEFKEEGWGRDERYKFELDKVNDKGVAETVHLGTVYDTDGGPGAEDTGEYFHLREVGVSTDKDKWKFRKEFDNQTLTITVHFDTDGAYTHSVKAAN